MLCDGRPVGYGHGPFLTYVEVSEINQLFKGGVVREHALVFCHFPHLAVIALDCIRGINHTSYIRRKLEVFSKPFPVILPRLDNDRVFLTPFFFQIQETSKFSSHTRITGFSWISFFHVKAKLPVDQCFAFLHFHVVLV